MRMVIAWMLIEAGLILFLYTFIIVRPLGAQIYEYKSVLEDVLPLCDQNTDIINTSKTSYCWANGYIFLNKCLGCSSVWANTEKRCASWKGKIAPAFNDLYCNAMTQTQVKTNEHR